MNQNNMEMRYSMESDYEAVVDTANRIFTMRKNENGETDYDHRYFQDLQSKIYADPQVMPPHLLAYSNGNMVGMVGMRERELLFGGETLRVCGIGTVGVVPEMRGQGIMRDLMNRADEDMKAQGVDIAELGGRRKRYSRYGYVTGCGGLNFNLERADVEDAPEEDLRFEEITDVREGELSFYAALRQKRFSRIERMPDEFPNVLRTGGRTALRVLLNGEPFGYCSVSRQYGDIAELDLADVKRLPSFLRAYMNAFSLYNLNLHNFSPYENGVNAVLLPIVSSVRMTLSERYRIFNYQKVVQAGLRAKAQLSTPVPGTLTLRITGYGTLRIEVGERINVSVTSGEADLEISEETATHLFLGAYGVFGTGVEGLPEFARGWFPLPVHIGSNDRI